MKDKITELKLFMSIEKELAYINEMNKKGWKLVYIKGGCLYTFVKTEPDEYVTILHGEEIENISEITAFASQCGYEIIPHTMDGLGKLIYFTGKKSVVPKDFVSSTEDKLKTSRIMLKTHKKLLIMYIILSVYMIFIDASLLVTCCLIEFDPFLVGVSVIISLIVVVYLALTIYVLMMTKKRKQQVRKLENELGIFE